MEIHESSVKMPRYLDLITVSLYPSPENFIRSLWKDLDIRSVLDVGAGTNGVFDYGHLTNDSNITKKAACDIHWLRPMAAEWELKLGVDAEKLTDHYPEKSFDMVTCFEVLEHVPNPIKALQEMCKVAKKIVIITSADELSHDQSPDSEQKKVESVNKYQAYIKQPGIKDMLHMGFEVRVESIDLRQLVCWKKL